MIKYNINTAATNDQKIKQYTGLSESDLFDLRFNTGIEFLKLQCGKDNWGRKHLEGSKFYWNWWLNTWHNRDAEWVNYMDKLLYTPSYREATNRYLLAHNLDLLYKSCNRSILDSGFALVINKDNTLRQLRRSEQNYFEKI